MDPVMQLRVDAALKHVHNICTDFDKAEEEIHAALTAVSNGIMAKIADMPGLRAAHEATVAARAKALQDNRDAIVAAGGTIPAPATASRG